MTPKQAITWTEKAQTALSTLFLFNLVSWGERDRIRERLKKWAAKHGRPPMLPNLSEIATDLAALLAEREQQVREECAKIAESSTDGVHKVLCTHIAAAIRAASHSSQ